MVKKHLKRLLAPEFWRMPKKAEKWAVMPRPGPHKKFESIPLQVLVRDILGLVSTGREAKSIIKTGEVMVDGCVRKDQKYPVGLLDVVTIPKLDQGYRVVPTAKGLGVLKISKKEAGLKICKICGKTTVKGGKIQLNLHDGKNILADKDVYRTGDSVLIEVPASKILDYIKLDKGSFGLIIRGKNIGRMGKIRDIIETTTKEPTKIICESDGEKIEVLKDYIVVIGKEGPLVKVSE